MHCEIGQSYDPRNDRVRNHSTFWSTREANARQAEAKASIDDTKDGQHAAQPTVCISKQALPSCSSKV